MYDEGYAAIYDRRKVMVFSDTNDAIEAITYIMTSRGATLSGMPGYHQAGLQ
jgi:hypothetical protein